MSPHAFTEEEVLALAREAYRRGEASFPIVAERCALLVIDLQDEFVKPQWTPFWVPEATRMIPRVRELVGAARSRGVPVIYTVFSASHGFLDRPRSGGAMPNRYPALAAPDPEWFRAGRIWHELAPAPEELVIHKPSYGAFYDTPLETVLKNLERDTVILCGTLTNLCCGTTARQAYERGFRVVFGSDVTATHDRDQHEGELRTLRYAFARVMTAAEIVHALGGSAAAGGPPQRET